MANTSTEKTAEEVLLDIMIDLDSRKSAPESQMKKKLMVLSTSRCGSTLFCDVLSNTGKIGDCKEWFNLGYIQAYGKMRGNTQVEFGEYLQFIITKTIGSTSTLSVNMHIEQYVELMKNKFDPFSLGFDHVVYLSRRQKLDQAVSLAKAWETGQWASGIAPSSDGPVDISHAKITNALLNILNSEETWRTHLKALTHAEYEYEEFRNLEQTKAFQSVLAALGESWEGSPISSMQPQADTSSKQLAQNFINYILDSDKD